MDHRSRTYPIKFGSPAVLVLFGICLLAITVARPTDSSTERLLHFDLAEHDLVSYRALSVFAGAATPNSSALFWEAYGLPIIALLTVCIAQALLICALLISRARRKRTEEILRESEKQFRVMADTAPVMVWRSDTEKRCDFFNKPWLEFTGRTMEQEFGHGWSEGVHPDDLERCLNTYNHAFDTREKFRMEYRLRRFEGEYRWILDTGVPRFGSDGSFFGYIGSCIDITDRRRAEDITRESEERYRIVAETASDAVITINQSSIIQFANRAAEKIFGYSVPELLGAELTMLMPGYLKRVHRDSVERYIKTGQRHISWDAIELPGVHKDGRIIPLELSFGEFVKNGEHFFTGIARDVTERKQAEERFRLAVEASPNAIVMVSQEGRIVLVNEQTEKLFGYQRDELIGQSVEILVPERFRGVHPSHRGAFFASPQTRPMGAGRDLFARRKDGTEFQVEIGLNPIQTREGIFVLTAIVDITERKRAASELRRQRDELAHLTRISAMGELSASLAHELNQPLTAILSNANAAQRFMAASPPELDEVREILKDIVQDDDRAAEIIRRMRGLVKKEELEIVPVDITQVIRDIVPLVHSDAVLRNIRLVLDFHSNVPLVHGDKVQLQQVVLNLLLNAFDAIKDCPGDERRVVVQVEPDDAHAVKVAVRDQGTGLTADKLGKIFEPFYTTKRDGLGMGLSISRSIIEAHGGRLWAENNPQRGATFHFIVPAERSGA